MSEIRVRIGMCSFYLPFTFATTLSQREDTGLVYRLSDHKGRNNSRDREYFAIALYVADFNGDFLL